MATTVGAETSCGGLIVTGGEYNNDYVYNETAHTLTIMSNKTITIRNTDPNTATTDKIYIDAGFSPTIILNNVNIDVSGTPDACAFKIADNSSGNVTVTLDDGTTNTLKSGANCAGL